MDITVLANTKRLYIVHCLKQPQTVSELLDKCDLSQPALSQHLRKLKDAGILQATREATKQIYSVVDPQLHTIVAQLLALHDR